MGLEIIPIGGYKEIGRNCVAVRADDEVIILDLGLQMDKYITFTSSERDFIEPNAKNLTEIEAIPDLRHIENLIDNVKAVCITHAHLDHVGAVPYLSNKFNADVHCTPFTAELINALCADDGIQLKNDIVSHDINKRFKITNSIDVEFIHVTHSTPQTVMIAVHTKYGTVLYANDFKLDNAPTLGPRTNTDRLREMNVKCLIMDSLYATEPIKTPSESIAREMLKDVLLGTTSHKKAVVVTTFASHIARLKSIIEIGKKLNRKIILLGRSMGKYVECAEKVGLVKFTDQVEIVAYGSKVKTWLKKCRHPEQYLMVVTGHQGEPNATLGKMTYGKDFKFGREDMVIFSSKIIPVDINIENRKKLEDKLNAMHVRIFRDIHVSGHAAREDHREVLNMVKPEHLIPTHGDMNMLNCSKELALSMGWSKDKIHIIGNGERLKLD